jgi:NitT/TauT family transport system ATP-binding protein
MNWWRNFELDDSVPFVDRASMSGTTSSPRDREYRGAALHRVQDARAVVDVELRFELELSGVSKEFYSGGGSVTALQDVSLSLKPQEFVSVLGRSGCGKTTLLRMLAGLTYPTCGHVSAGGRPLWNERTRDPETMNKLGLVFQDANLFPWYTVEDNIALPLKIRGVSRSDRLARARSLCELLGISGFERCYPRELSGGMRQRVAIARALSYNPSILLMDEPFGALDALTRDKMNLELQALAAASRAAVVLVTHSIREAVFLSDRVVLLSPRPGRVRSVTKVDFTRPRQLDLEGEPRFQQIVKELRNQLDEES